MNSSSTFQKDYMTRYEDLLLQQRNLYQKVFTKIDGSNCQNNKDDNPASTTRNHDDGMNSTLSNNLSSILINHASMNTMLQCCAREAVKEENKKQQGKNDGCENLEAVKILYEQRKYEQNFDFDIHLDMQRENNTEAGKTGYANSSSCTRMTLGTLVSLSALDNHRQLHLGGKSNQTNLVDNNFHKHYLRDNDEHDDSDVDGFFQDYPECIRKNIIHHSCHDSDFNHDENHDGINDDIKKKKNTTLPSKVTHQNSLIYDKNNISNAINEKRSHILNPTFNADPSKRSSVTHSSIREVKSTFSSSWQKYDEQRNNSNSNYMNGTSIQEHHNDYESCQQTNEFQYNNYQSFSTAAEFKMKNKSDHNTTQYQTKNGSNKIDQEASIFQRNKSEYSNHNSLSNSQENIHHSKPIHNSSAGLKRKFQIPKPRNNTMDASRSNNGASNSSNKQQVVVEEDDDELPEQLKGCDKELVAKIQNEIVDSGEPITFSDIAGLEDAKQTVLELVCWPMKRPDLFTGLRRGPNGLLLFGPPGTGKTLIGKAISHESGATFFSISSSSLTSKWIGEGEKLVRTLFAVAAYREPAVVFIDEIDSLLTQRKSDENEASRRIKTEFLVQLDGTGTSGQGRVLVIGATNRPHELDDAARRRFVKRLYIPLPKQSDREKLLRTLLSKNSNCLSDDEISKLSNDTEGFSGADIKSLCSDAALGPIRQLGSRALEIGADEVPPISYRHFRQSLRGMTPSVADNDLDIYLEWNKTYGTKNMTLDDDFTDEDQ